MTSTSLPAFLKPLYVTQVYTSGRLSVIQRVYRCHKAWYDCNRPHVCPTILLTPSHDRALTLVSHIISFLSRKDFECCPRAKAVVRLTLLSLCWVNCNDVDVSGIMLYVAVIILVYKFMMKYLGISFSNTLLNKTKSNKYQLQWRGCIHFWLRTTQQDTNVSYVYVLRLHTQLAYLQRRLSEIRFKLTVDVE